ncbi:ABC transporter ATP-binding protein [Streptomyces qinglanensis]|uniref:ABC transporter ATP-binding protein n=1 Tax=Streptomyces qinglanensis TaxID=943816 RepID=UPI003D73E586
MFSIQERSESPDTGAAEPGDPQVLAVEELTVRYGDFTAVNNVGFTVGRGEIFGLLGRNGAGKTSTIAAAAGLLRPAAGHVRVLGRQLEPGRRSGAWLGGALSLQPQKTSLFPRLQVEETLRMWAALYPDPRPVPALIDELGLTDKARTRAARLSGGQQQRLLLATALVGNTPLVVLDEPTTGLDPHASRDAWAVINRARAGGTTFLLSTHAMAEAEERCDRLAVLHEGRLRTSGTPAQIVRGLTRGSTVTVRSSQEGLLRAARAEFGTDAVRAEPGDGGGAPRFTVATERPERAVAWCEERAPEADVRIHRPTLEDAFLAATGTAPAAVADDAVPAADDAVPAAAGGARAEGGSPR